MLIKQIIIRIGTSEENKLLKLLNKENSLAFGYEELLKILKTDSNTLDYILNKLVKENKILMYFLPEYNQNFVMINRGR